MDGVNIKFKAIRNQEDIVEKKPKSCPLHVSKVSLVDPEKKVATRTSYGSRKDTGEKIRVAKKSGTIIPKPNRDQLARAVRAKAREIGPKDTIASKVLEVTYTGEDL